MGGLMIISRGKEERSFKKNVFSSNLNTVNLKFFPKHGEIFN